MCRIINIKILILAITATSLTAFANDAKDTPADITKKIEDQVKIIKNEKDFAEKNKKLSELIDTVNKELNNYSNIVTQYKTKILESSGEVNKSVIQEKDNSEAIYGSWVVFKVALEPNYDLFVEKKNNYHCESVSDEIWQNYAPTSPNVEKISLDPYTKKAVELSIEIALDLCKSMPQ